MHPEPSSARGFDEASHHSISGSIQDLEVEWFREAGADPVHHVSAGSPGRPTPPEDKYEDPDGINPGTPIATLGAPPDAASADPLSVDHQTANGCRRSPTLGGGTLRIRLV